MPSSPPTAASCSGWWDCFGHLELSQLLPDDTPTHLVRAAYAVCACEPDTDFTFVLDLVPDGAQKLKRQS